MLYSEIVTSENELWQIHRLNQENLKSHLDPVTQKQEGFVSWVYPFQLLKQMHRLSPSIIVKDDDRVVGYALTTLKESSSFHPDLELLLQKFESIIYKHKPLVSYNFYCMGQICVEKDYRGQGIVSMLYKKHREIYSRSYEFILTEISSNNPRSMKAHEKLGFEIIHTYHDMGDEWNVVIWNWE